MKVLHIIDNLGIGGKERQLVELLVGLQQRNDVACEVLVLSDKVHPSHLAKLTVPVHKFPRKQAKDPRVFARLYEIHRRFRPDIIQTWEFMCSVYAAAFCPVYDIKFINNAIQNAPATIPKKAKWRSRLTFPLSDVILANSRAGLAAFNVNNSKTTFIHNGFDATRIADLEDEQSVRERYQLDRPHIVGMVATLSNKKDHPTFLQAAIEILGKRDDVTFLVIGEGPNAEACQAMVPEKYRAYIRFPGNVTPVESLINTFTVGVLATFTEGISNTIMEYMALGKPVVASDGGGTREILIDGETGFLCKVSDATDLAEKIMSLLNSRPLAEKMGAAGKKRIHEDFNLELMTNKFVKLYENCLSKNRSKEIEKVV